MKQVKIKSRPARVRGSKQPSSLLSLNNEDTLILSSLFKRSPIGFAFFDIKGRYKKINKILAEINGYSASYHVGKTIGQIIPSLEKEANKIIKEVIKTKQPLTIELKGFTQKEPNKEKWWNEHWFPVFDGKKVIGVSTIVIDITKRKRAEESLRQERNLLQSVMDGAMRSHLVYLDRDFNFVRVNKSYAQRCGFPSEEMIGKNHFALYPNKENEAIFKRVRDTGVAVEYHDKPFIFPNQPDRGVTYWDWTLMPIKSGTGDVHGLVFSLIETTERKLAEAELERVASFPILNPNPIVEVDLEGNITFMNPVAEKSFPNLITQGTMHPMLTDWSKLVKLCLDNSKKLPEREVIVGDRWYHQTLYYAAEEKRLRIYSLDVTMRKLAEDALRGSENKYRLLFENMTEMFQILEPVFDKKGEVIDFRYIEVNKATEKLTGKKKKEIEGKMAKELWGIVEKYWFEMLGRVVRTGEPSRMDNLNKELGYYYDVNAWKVSENRVAIVFSNITERKRVEEALKELNRRKDEFISIASHELKTPITSIKAYSQIISQRLAKEGNQPLLGMMVRLENQVDKLTKLVTDLLDASRIQSGKLQLNIKKFNLDNLIKETVSDVSTTTTKPHSIRIKGKAKTKIEADRFRLSQVILNLLTNAIKYSPDNKNIIVEAKKAQGKVIVSVKDFGIGISKNQQSHLFERFFQARKPLNNHGGFTSLGLGLYISSEIIKRHGGTINCRSEEGKGSTFYFTLPIKSSSK